MSVQRTSFPHEAKRPEMREACPKEIITNLETGLRPRYHATEHPSHQNGWVRTNLSLLIPHSHPMTHNSLIKISDQYFRGLPFTA